MKNRLQEVLNGEAGTYMIPFFWLHGEDSSRLTEEMDKIWESGIDAICVESRPHPDFLGERWWKDLDRIMEHAGKRGMKVWILDDAHFPTGFCNGMITEDSAYGKRYLDHYCIDVAGPLCGCSFMVLVNPGERLVGVAAGRRDRKNPSRLTNLVDLTDRVKDGKVYADIPDGLWCIVVVKETRTGTGRKNYISTIEKEAVRFLIDVVYEAHYQHYREEFGRTFAGFFSDEPEIGNCLDEYGFQSGIGQQDMKLPWSKNVEAELQQNWKEQYLENLISLWFDTKDGEENASGRNRYEFMDLISRLYSENFCSQIGEWCRAHSVEYIGHVIEDNGMHARLGLGAGHYFRALWGQDMAGIDVVLQQIRPQLDDCLFYRVRGTAFYDGEFFHYGLAKLGSSLAHLDAKKHGRTVCEIFGAYGWSEGLKLMKWLLDHMLVNGVNYFVPHAFSLKAFPDPDCPPHFYAQGKNPQYPYFRDLMNYGNRVSHLIQNGVHKSCAALLYPAEQEWMGAHMPFERAAKVLTRNQIDFDVLPLDFILSAEVKEGMLHWGQEKSPVLVIPGSSYITGELADWLCQASEQGLRIVFVDQMPRAVYQSGRTEECWKTERIFCCMESELAGCLEQWEISEIRTATYEPWLRYYHYQTDCGDEIWLFFSETITEKLETTVWFRKGLPMSSRWYDPWENQMKQCEWIGRKNGRELKLQLNPYELKVLYVEKNGETFAASCLEYRREDPMLTGEENLELAGQGNSGLAGQGNSELAGQGNSELAEQGNSALPGPEEEAMNLTDGEWELWLDGMDENGSEFHRHFPALSSLPGDISSHGWYPYFSGTMKYRNVFEKESRRMETSAEGAEARQILDLGEVYETAEVWLNGREVGRKIAPPYRWDVTGMLCEGRNCLEIVVINTLAHSLRDRRSMTMPLEPSGLLGPVKNHFLQNKNNA